MKRQRAALPQVMQLTDNKRYVRASFESEQISICQWVYLSEHKAGRHSVWLHLANDSYSARIAVLTRPTVYTLNRECAVRER